MPLLKAILSQSINQIPQSQHPRSELKKKKEEEQSLRTAGRKGRVRFGCGGESSKKVGVINPVRSSPNKGLPTPGVV